MLGRLVQRTFASVFVAVLARLADTTVGAARHERPIPRAVAEMPRRGPLVAASAPAATSSPSPLGATSDTRRRRLLRAGFDVVLVAALGFTIFIAYGLIGNRWYHVVAVEGGSMEPVIMRGDLIVVTRAPAKIEPGMILVMGVDGRMVTHRVKEVRADGSIVTQGDANPIPDDWHGKPIQVFGEYQFAIPALGRILPISNSGASFTDVAAAAQRINVGPWATPTPTPTPTPSPALRASVRIEPATIGADEHGDRRDRGDPGDRGPVTAFVKLPAPHKVTEIVRASIKLCYRGTCISNTGTKIDGKWIRATFATSDVMALVGKDRGQLTLTVQGGVSGYPAGFVGQGSVRVGSSRGPIVGGWSMPMPSPTPTGS